MTTIDAPEEPVASARPFPLSPHFGYGGLMRMHTGAHVWWTEEGKRRSGVIREIHRGQVTRIVGGQSRTCCGTIEDKALFIDPDDAGEPLFLNESKCRRVIA